MTTRAGEERSRAAAGDEDDVIALLLDQHARIRDLFDEVSSSQGDDKERTFDQLRSLLAVHETSEEMLLRPVTRRSSGADVADARDSEEREADQALAKLEKLNVDSAEFALLFDEFHRAVAAHADEEEREEFPLILSGCDEGERQKLGRSMRRVQAMAPTRAHPSTAGSTAAQWMIGPFAAMVDRVRDAFATHAEPDRTTEPEPR